jgi:GTP-binding protein HflX
VDISHPNFEEQYEVVEQTINELLTKQTELEESKPWSKKQNGNRKTEKTVAQIPRIVVFNKVDAFTYIPKEEDDLTPMKRENISLDELKKTWMAKLHDDCIFISAKEKLHIDKLRNDLYKMVAEIHAGRYPFDNFLW